MEKTKKLLEWSNEFSVKIGTIDDHHKKIIDYINELYQAHEEDTTKEALASMLNKLIKYADFHFSYEENLLALHGFEALKFHSDEHLVLKNKLQKIVQDFSLDKAAVSMDLMEFLKDWLIDHILVKDMAYSEFLVQKGVQ